MCLGPVSMVLTVPQLSTVTPVTVVLDLLVLTVRRDNLRVPGRQTLVMEPGNAWMTTGQRKQCVCVVGAIVLITSVYHGSRTLKVLHPNEYIMHLRQKNINNMFLRHFFQKKMWEENNVPTIFHENFRLLISGAEWREQLHQNFN